MNDIEAVIYCGKCGEPVFNLCRRLISTPDQAVYQHYTIPTGKGCDDKDTIRCNKEGVNFERQDG